MADIHIGAHPNKFLKELEIKSFNQALDKCVKLQVDFILISGDLFHSAEPDLDIIYNLLNKLVEVKNLKIPIYVLYGSHDYAIGSKCIIDILEGCNVITKIPKNSEIEDNSLTIEFLSDPKTGVKITGIPARKKGLERDSYKKLNREKLENEPGFKIFMFHSGIVEFKPPIPTKYIISLSDFPKEFNYYAGGHIHTRDEFRQDKYGPIVYPGPLITGYGKDLLSTIKGKKRGFYLVSFDNEIKEVQFIDLHLLDKKGQHFQYDLNGKNSIEVNDELEELKNKDMSKKIIVLEFVGKLDSGDVSDITKNLRKIKNVLIDNGAHYVEAIWPNTKSDSSKNLDENLLNVDNNSIIEKTVFENNRSSSNMSTKLLKDKNEISTSEALLEIFRQDDSGNNSLKGASNLLDLSQFFEEEEN